MVSDQSPVAPWTPDTAEAVLKEYLRDTSLCAEHWRLVSFRQNAIFHLPAPNLSIRIYNPAEDASRAQWMVKVAKALQACGVPAIRLWPGTDEQPATVGNYAVTAWEWLDAVESPGSAHEGLGALLRQLHAARGVQSLAAPSFNPVGKIERRLRRLTVEAVVPEDIIGELRALLDEVREQLRSVHGTKLGSAILHGDALLGNAVHTRDGWCLIDLDSVCRGPREWDLVPTLIAADRFGHGTGAWRDLLTGYGVDEPASEDLSPLRRLKELSMTTVLCFKYGLGAAVRQEVARRIEHLEANDSATRWYPVSDLR